MNLTEHRALNANGASLDRRVGILLSKSWWISVATLVVSTWCTASYAATTITRTSSFDYDPVSGLLTKEVVEPADSNLCLVTVYGYDSYGHKNSVTVRNCNGSAAVTPGGQTESAAPVGIAVFAPRTVTNTFTTDQRFVASTTDPLNYAENKSTDVRFGSVTLLTGPNSLTTTWAYDSVGRKTQEVRSDSTQTKWDYVYCNNAGFTPPAGSSSASCSAVPTSSGTVVPAYYVQVNALKTDGASANGAYARTYFDVLGREIRSETQGFDGGGVSQLVFQDVQYNALGQVSAKSRPYYSGATAYWIIYAYDTLGRVVSISSPDAAGTSTTTTNYNGLITTITDPLNHTTTHTKNLGGQLATVVDVKGNALNSLYDPYGNLVQTTDAKGNVTSIAYDPRGRKTGLYDPDMGVWAYAYNAAGELVQQTDAKGQTSTVSYDVLGRMTARTQAGLNSTWYFDRYADGSACNKGIGKLCEARGDNGYSRKHVYDGYGRPSSTVSVVDAGYTSGVTYDAQSGRPDTQTYPSGMQVRNVYSALGYLYKVIDVRTGIALWTANSVDALGHVQQYTYGNGVVTNNSYYPDGRLNTTQAGPGNAVQSLMHAFDLAGNMSSRLDLLTGVTASYAYDEVNRLTSENRSGGGLGAAQVIGWSYDSIGNMTSRTESGATNTYNYPSSGAGSSRPHAVANVSGSVNGVSSPIYLYDLNGNMTSGAGRTVSWTSFDKAQSIANATARLDYLYDAEHERAKESYYLNGALQRTTIYLNPSAGSGLYYEQENGVAGLKQKHYVTAGGSTVAMITFNGSAWSTQYWHTDHLGSTSVVTNEGGAVVERLAYEPFGKRRNANGVTDPNGTLTPTSTDRGFTGHEHLDEVGLINMNGRVYDPGLGRFMSADPFIQSALSLQSYNRYSYAWNSPLNGTDPSGHTWLSDRWHEVWRNNNVQAIVTVAIAATVGPGYAAEYTALRTTLQTGSLEQGLKAGAISWATSEAMKWAGDTFPVNRIPYESVPVQNLLAHAAIGCISSAAGGGSCRSGALSGGAGAAWSNFGPSMNGWRIDARVAMQFIVGGTASRLGGGKFANGGITSAFGYLFNSLCHATKSCAEVGATNGSAAGLVVGVGLSAGCDLGTFGGCILANPGIIGGSIIGLGSLGYGAGRLIDSLTFSDGADSEQPKAEPKSDADKAKELGYDRPAKDPPFNPHGQRVFTNGKDFITPDVDQHNGGEWKKFDRRGNRVGTYDGQLNWIGK